MATALKDVYGIPVKRDTYIYIVTSLLKENFAFFLPPHTVSVWGFFTPFYKTFPLRSNSLFNVPLRSNSTQPTSSTMFHKNSCFIFHSFSGWNRLPHNKPKRWDFSFQSTISGHFWGIVINSTGPVEFFLSTVSTSMCLVFFDSLC